MKKAFTLVELLVAVVLLTLLIGTALFSYRQVLLNIAKAERSTFNEILKVHQVRTSIESMQHYVVDDYNQFSQPMQKLHLFFKGNEHYFQFITLNPTLSNTPSLASYECKDETLLYTEEPLYGKIDVNRPEFLEQSSTLVYWDNLDFCSFSYAQHSKFFATLDNTIPSSVNMEFREKNSKKIAIFTNIKSDNNLSTGEIYELLYGE